MCNLNALPAYSAAEGVLVLGPNIITVSSVAPPSQGLTAGPNGTAVGRFGWYGDDGIVRNLRQNASDRRGVVVLDVPPTSDWRRIFFDEVTNTWRIREGLPLTLLQLGIVGVKFPLSAVQSEPVYANVLDGSAISGYSADGELTPWAVINSTGLNGTAYIRNQ